MAVILVISQWISLSVQPKRAYSVSGIFRGPDGHMKSIEQDPSAASVVSVTASELIG